MRKFILFITGSAMAAVSAFAAPACATGTYTSYVALGSTGCSDGDATFSNFSGLTFTNSLGVPTIPTDDILVTPGGTALNPTLLFTYVVGSTPAPVTVNQSGQIFSFSFGYLLSLTGATLSDMQMDTTLLNTNGGSVAATKNTQLTTGGTIFTSQASDNGTAHSTSTTISGPVTPTTGSGNWNVQDTVSLQAQNGTATQNNFENLFTLQATSASVPEANAIVLMGSGLLCIGLIRVKRRDPRS